MIKILSILFLFLSIQANANSDDCSAIQKELNFYNIKCEKLAFNVDPGLIEQYKDIPAKFSGFFKISGDLYAVLNNGNLFKINQENKIRFLGKIIPNLDKSYFGGLLNLIYIKKKNVLILYSLIQEKEKKVLYLSILDTQNNFKLIGHHKLNNQDTKPSQLGGGMSASEDLLFLQIGAADDAFISKQSSKSQDIHEIYGKVISIPLDLLIQGGELSYGIVSSGHKHSQGLLKTKNSLLEVEHSVDGGDEINNIKASKNYGYNKFGYTKVVVDGKNRFLNEWNKKFQDPIFYFSPSIAPSDISECNFDNADHSFAYLPCIFVSSLAQKSVFIIKFKRANFSKEIPNNPVVISVEKIDVGERVRKILPVDKNVLYVLTDSMNIFKLIFLPK